MILSASHDYLTLRYHHVSPIPMGMEGILPEKLRVLSLLEIAKLPLYHGNRRVELGEFFSVSGSPTSTTILIQGTASSITGIGTGMSTGAIVVEGDAGMHAGAGVVGGKLLIEGNAGDWLGAEMRGGTIEVRGNAGDQVGAAYRGSRRGMTGGVILCRGNAGDEVGLLMRRGLIIVENRCGSFAGASMIAGSIVVLGQLGSRPAAGMKRGTIIAMESIDSLSPSFRLSCLYRPTYLGLLERELTKMGVGRETFSNYHNFACYRGDLLYGGKGELLIGRGA